MSNTIIDTNEITEIEWGGNSEPDDTGSDIVATVEPENKGIEFHVSMRGYTMSDMEALIIEAAARQLLGSRDMQFRKQIEERAIALITEQANAKLSSVTAEIIDAPITPTFGEKKPVTMREFIGLTGQAYLTETVDSHTGNKPTDSWGRSNNVTRVAYIVQKAMDVKFKKEIEAATSAAVREVQVAIKAQHEKLIAEEKARFLEALKKAAD